MVSRRSRARRVDAIVDLPRDLLHSDLMPQSLEGVEDAVPAQQDGRHTHRQDQVP